MALNARELFETNDKGDTSKRIEAHVIQPKTLAQGSETLPALTPMAYNTSTNFWVPWDANGANGTDTMRGLLMEEAVLDSNEEILANIMLAGKVHYDDILAAVEERAVEVEADLATELKSGPRDIGIFVYGLPSVR